MTDPARNLTMFVMNTNRDGEDFAVAAFLMGSECFAFLRKELDEGFTAYAVIEGLRAPEDIRTYREFAAWRDAQKTAA